MKEINAMGGTRTTDLRIKRRDSDPLHHDALSLFSVYKLARPMRSHNDGGHNDNNDLTEVNEAKINICL